MNNSKTFKKLFELHKAIGQIKVGVEASQADVLRLFDLLQAQKLEALAKALESTARKPKAPIHYIFKPFIIDKRIGDMQAPCGVDKYDKRYKNMFYKTHDVVAAMRIEGQLRIMPTIFKEVFYFQNRIQAARYLAWAEKHCKEVYRMAKSRTVIGTVAFNTFIRELLDKHVGPHIKGFKLFRKQTYVVVNSMRMISGHMLHGFCKYKSFKKATKYTLTKLKGWKPKQKRMVITDVPTLDAVAIANLPALEAVAI